MLGFSYISIIALLHWKKQFLPGWVAQLVNTSSWYAKVRGLVFDRGPYKRQLVSKKNCNKDVDSLILGCIHSSSDLFPEDKYKHLQWRCPCQEVRSRTQQQFLSWSPLALFSCLSPAPSSVFLLVSFFSTTFFSLSSHSFTLSPRLFFFF